MGKEIDISTFEIKDNPKYPDDKDIYITIKTKQQVFTPIISSSALDYYHDGLQKVAETVRAEFAEEPKRNKKVTFSPIVSELTLGEPVKNTKYNKFYFSLSACTKFIDTTLKQENATETEINMIKFLSNVTTVRCGDAIRYQDPEVVKQLAKFISLMESMKAITFPSSLSIEACAPCVTTWQTLWEKEPPIQAVQPVVVTSEETSTSSPVAMDEDEPQPLQPAENLDEEHIWYGAPTVGAAALALTTVATVHAVRRGQRISPTGALYLLGQFDALTAHVLQRVDSVPMVGSVLRFTGSVVSHLVQLGTGRNARP